MAMLTIRNELEVSPATLWPIGEAFKVLICSVDVLSLHIKFRVTGLKWEMSCLVFTGHSDENSWFLFLCAFTSHFAINWEIAGNSNLRRRAEAWWKINKHAQEKWQQRTSGGARQSRRYRLAFSADGVNRQTCCAGRRYNMRCLGFSFFFLLF